MFGLWKHIVRLDGRENVYAVAVALREFFAVADERSR